jgi:hypothetical protein
VGVPVRHSFSAVRPGAFRAILSFIRKKSARTAPRQRSARPELRQPLGIRICRGISARELKADLDGFDKQILQPLEALLPRGCEKVFLTGNHERMPDQDLIESMPELDGMIDFKQYLHLTERGFKVIPLGGDYQIGGLLCIHPGEAVGSAGSNAAKKAVEIYCQNVFRGHGHQLQSSSKCSPSSSKKTAAA